VQAQLLGVKVEAVNILFYVCAGFIIALCVRMLGIYVAMMVLISPAVIALIAFRTMKMVIIGTIAFSVLFALSGFALSFTFDSLPAEPTIIVVFGFASFGVWGGKKIFSLFRRA
jgi:ABC-type Mn2+/Zn2+ transport system permease subunit